MAPAPTDVLDRTERWFLVNTQSGREWLAGEHLTRQGFRPFIPCTWRSVRHARKIRTARAAYFPGYLFVPLDLELDRWRPIDGTVGVLRIVKANDRPLAAPLGLVESLRAATGGDGVLDLAGPSLARGQSVRLIRGPFAEQLGVIDCLRDADRVRVLLTLMNQTIPVELSRQDLALAT
jgi:transcriptional antiterminator RfaH